MNGGTKGRPAPYSCTLFQLVRSQFRNPKKALTGPVESGLIVLNCNKWAVEVCPDLEWEIPP